MMLNRRAFTAGVIAATASATLRAKAAGAPKSPLADLPSSRSTFKGVTVGISTYSLSQLPLDVAIHAIADIGAGMSSLHPSHIEPSFGAIRFRSRTGPPPTPDQIAAAKASREKLRDWRMTVPLETFEEVGKKFKAAGIILYSY